MNNRSTKIQASTTQQSQDQATNPVSIPIEANCPGSINCISHAAYFQRVTLSWNDKTVVFSGTGEGKPMETADRETAYLLAAEAQAYEISATFEYSKQGPNGPFYSATVCDPVITDKGMFKTIEVTSEDSVDHDDNDSYLTIVLVSDPPGKEATAAQSEQVTPRSVASGSLELHAKTYYNDPYTSGGDEHYVTCPPFHGDDGPVNYAGTSWKLLDGGCHDQVTPFGGYLTVNAYLNNSGIKGLEGAELSLTTVVSYWGSRPSGYRSVDWTASLHNSPYKVTKVTN